MVRGLLIFSPLERALAAEVLRGGQGALLGLTGLGALLAAAQALLGAPIMPEPSGICAVVLGLVPAALTVSLPVGFLIGAVAAGQRWAERGEWLALAAAGIPARRVALPLALLGAALGGSLDLNTHLGEPLGRAAAQRALAQGRPQLSAGQPAVVGDVLVYAAEVQGERLGALTVALGDVVVQAEEGVLDGGLRLGRGQALGLPPSGQGTTPGWRLRFDAATLPLAPAPRRVELWDRTTPERWGLIGRMQAHGKAAPAERLALYKRTALPLCLPLLGLIGLCLGARGGRPALVTTATALAWWAVLRVGDQTVEALGPGLAAAGPPTLLLGATLLAWATWRDR